MLFSTYFCEVPERFSLYFNIATRLAREHTISLKCMLVHSTLCSGVAYVCVIILYIPSHTAGYDHILSPSSNPPRSLVVSVRSWWGNPFSFSQDRRPKQPEIRWSSSSTVSRCIPASPANHSPARAHLPILRASSLALPHLPTELTLESTHPAQELTNQMVSSYLSAMCGLTSPHQNRSNSFGVSRNHTVCSYSSPG